MTKQQKQLINLSILSILVLISWLYQPSRNIWTYLDEKTFWMFNDSLKEGFFFWQAIWALTNNRAFDLVIAISLLFLFLRSGKKNPRHPSSEMLSRLIIAAIIAFIAQEVGQALPIERLSATLQHPDAFRLKEVITWIDFKDSSSDSFPGDHGVVLFVVVAYGWSYFVYPYKIIGVILAILFTLPRVVVGAHWLSDELAGALPVGVVILSLYYITPISGWIETKLIPWLERYILRYTPKSIKRLF